MILVMGIALGTAMNGKAQITASNPLEWMALAEGNELLEKQIDSQINGQKKTAILQNTIAQMAETIQQLFERRQRLRLFVESLYPSV